jgi:hypothetical protein
VGNSVSPRWAYADRTQIDPFCVPPPIDTKENHRMQIGGYRVHITGVLSPRVTKRQYLGAGRTSLAALVPIRQCGHGEHHRRVVVCIVWGLRPSLFGWGPGLYPSGGPALLTNDASRKVD